MQQVSIRVDNEIMQRLSNLAKITNRTKTFYVKEALLNYLEDLEDYFLANKELEKIQQGEKTYSFEEICKEANI